MHGAPTLGTVSWDGAQCAEHRDVPAPLAGRNVNRAAVPVAAAVGNRLAHRLISKVPPGPTIGRALFS